MMSNDSLRDEIGPVRRAALAYLASNKRDAKQRQFHINALRNSEARLESEINERSGPYLSELAEREAAAISSRRTEIDQDPRYQRAYAAQKAIYQEFEDLRRVNGGGYPKNISPVLYVIPLILVGVAEWYVNFSTFSAMFIPVFAISATIIVAAVFAWASHLHGAYVKQISEIVHPSVEYRNVLGRKIALVIATVLLFAAFGTVVWLRWLVISEQLGINAEAQSGAFGDASSSLVWSKVAPTIVINLLIWGLGTLYSWALHEKVPRLRESYRDYLHASRAVEKRLRSFQDQEKRIRAQYDRERDKNRIAIDEYRSLLEDVKSSRLQLQENEAA
jgi:hypothetical protein